MRLTASIPRFRQISIGKKKPTVFEIRLSAGGKGWTVERRYSEFFDLFVLLKARFALTARLPRKTLLGNKDPKFIEQRRKGLQDWLSTTLNVDGVLNVYEVVEFLKIPSEVQRRVGSLRSDPRTASSVSSTSSRTVDSATRSANDPHATSNRISYSSPHAALGASDDDEFDSDDIPTDDDTLTGGIIDSLEEGDIIDDFVRGLSDQKQDAVIAADVFARQQVPKPSRKSPVSFIVTQTVTPGIAGDLAFEKGDKVTVVGQDSDSGWWIGTRNGKDFGLVPVHFLDITTAERAHGSDMDVGEFAGEGRKTTTRQWQADSEVLHRRIMALEAAQHVAAEENLSDAPASGRTNSGALIAGTRACENTLIKDILLLGMSPRQREAAETGSQKGRSEGEALRAPVSSISSEYDESPSHEAESARASSLRLVLAAPDGAPTSTLTTGATSLDRRANAAPSFSPKARKGSNLRSSTVPRASSGELAQTSARDVQRASIATTTTTTTSTAAVTAPLAFSQQDLFSKLASLQLTRQDGDALGRPVESLPGDDGDSDASALSDSLGPGRTTADLVDDDGVGEARGKSRGGALLSFDRLATALSEPLDLTHEHGRASSDTASQVSIESDVDDGPLIEGNAELDAMLVALSFTAATATSTVTASYIDREKATEEEEEEEEEEEQKEEEENEEKEEEEEEEGGGELEVREDVDGLR